MVKEFVKSRNVLLQTFGPYTEFAHDTDKPDTCVVPLGMIAKR
jgi:hypothetical protein